MQVWCEGKLVGELNIPYPGNRSSIFLIDLPDPEALIRTDCDDLDLDEEQGFELPIRRRNAQIDWREGDDPEGLRHFMAKHKVGADDLQVVEDSYRCRTNYSWAVLECHVRQFEDIFDREDFIPE